VIITVTVTELIGMKRIRVTVTELIAIDGDSSDSDPIDLTNIEEISFR